MSELNIPRILIAATQSGAGKTSVTLGIIASLKRRGLKIQTFKVGPDFLDPSYLTLASGRPCYNLDGWMMGRDYVSRLFCQASQGADVAVIEGVMGLFDGSGPSDSTGSTAEIACWLDMPVLLVVNAHGMGRSLAPVVKGFAEFEPGLKIAGIIANHSGSDHHRAWLEQSLEGSCLPPLLGAVPRGAFPTLSSRHLGLVTADPQHLHPSALQALADVLEKHVELDIILQRAREASSFLPPSATDRSRDCSEKGFSLMEKRASIGVAQDRAFHFYYADNLEELARRGCRLISFSPLVDRKLPEGLDGLYFGGGYPEEYARALSDNREMIEGIQRFASAGLPIYAECGGLMYLTQGIETSDGKRHPMVGLLPTLSRMLGSLKSLGYVEIKLMTDSLWGKEDARLRGHEFHYSELTADPLIHGDWSTVYQVSRPRSHGPTMEGFQQGKILASYIHLHWASRPPAMEAFISMLERRRGGYG